MQDNQGIVLFVGALDLAHRFKGLPVLLKAMTRLDNAMLLVVGEGSLRQRYQRLAGELGLSDRVRFVGGVTDVDLPAYYAACDVLVLPSVSTEEIFGLVLLEAMASAKPVIASNLPGVRQLVDDGITGFLVTPGNVDELASRIRTLLSNADLSRRLGEAARKKIESRYSWNLIGSRLEEIYQEIVS